MLQTRLARLFAEFSSSQQKTKQRLTRLEQRLLDYQLPATEDELLSVPISTSRKTDVPNSVG